MPITNLGKKFSPKWRRRISKALKAKHKKGELKGVFTKGHRINNGRTPHNKGGRGIHYSPGTEFKRENVIGSKNHNWKGGVTSINEQIRKSPEYKLWRESVFRRDNYTCIWCGKVGDINADHIKPFAYFPELRFAIDNGRTLCVPCHKTTPTYLKKQKDDL